MAEHIIKKKIKKGLNIKLWIKCQHKKYDKQLFKKYLEFLEAQKDFSNAITELEKRNKGFQLGKKFLEYNFLKGLY